MCFKNWTTSRGIQVIDTIQSYRHHVVTHSFSSTMRFLMERKNAVFVYNENGGWKFDLFNDGDSKPWAYIDPETSKVIDMRKIYEICFEKQTNEEEQKLKIIQKFDDFLLTN